MPYYPHRTRRPRAYAAWVGDLRGLAQPDDDAGPRVPATSPEDRIKAIIGTAVADGISGGVDRVAEKYGGLMLFGFVFIGTCAAVTAVASVITAASVSGG